MGFELTRDEPATVDRVHESKSVLGLALGALRSHVDGQLSRARDVLGSLPLPAGDSPGAPALRAEREEAELLAAQVDVLDLLGRGVDGPQTRIALARGPRDAEDERGAQRGPN
jgi:hypothetical protein